MNVGKSMRIALAMQELTQNELAQKIDASKQHISLIARNKQNPSLKMTKNISVALGYRVSEFIALGE